MQKSSCSILPRPVSHTSFRCVVVVRIINISPPIKQWPVLHSSYPYVIFLSQSSSGRFCNRQEEKKIPTIVLLLWLLFFPTIFLFSIRSTSKYCFCILPGIYLASSLPFTCIYVLRTLLAPFPGTYAAVAGAVLGPFLGRQFFLEYYNQVYYNIVKCIILLSSKPY